MTPIVKTTLAALLATAANGFVVAPGATRTQTHLTAHRRDFIAASAGLAAGILGTSLAWALEDLDAPTEDEEKARQVRSIPMEKSRPTPFTRLFAESFGFPSVLILHNRGNIICHVAEFLLFLWSVFSIPTWLQPIDLTLVSSVNQESRDGSKVETKGRAQGQGCGAKDIPREHGK